MNESCPNKRFLRVHLSQLALNILLIIGAIVVSLSPLNHVHILPAWGIVALGALSSLAIRTWRARPSRRLTPHASRLTFHVSRLTFHNPPGPLVPHRRRDHAGAQPLTAHAVHRQRRAQPAGGHLLLPGVEAAARYAGLAGSSRKKGRRLSRKSGQIFADKKQVSVHLRPGSYRDRV